MNTLEMIAFFGAVFARLGWNKMRAWPSERHPRILPALWLVYTASVLVGCFVVFLYFAIHPAEIQPISQVLPGWMVWALPLLVALYVLFWLLSLAETIYGRLRRRAQEQ